MIAGAGDSVAGDRRSQRLGSTAVGLVALAEENGMLLVLACVAALAFLTRLPSDIGPDGWMVLLAGREVVQHGLPSHDALTVWAHGREWVDQQWLAQAAMYRLERLGGIRLVMIAHAVLATGGFTAACGVARRRGASALSVTWIGALGLLAFYPEASNMRAQSFAYLLFVAVLALLLADHRHCSNWVFLVLPLLALWANMHGSVVVGAGLVSLYGLLALPGSVGIGLMRPLVLTALPWGCVFASPYASSLPSYYRWILFDAHLSRFVTEWAPTTLSLVSVSVFVLAVGGAWFFGRARGAARAFEVVAFLATAVLAIQAKRNFPWFALAAVVILPPLLDRVRPAAAPARRTNRIVAVAAALGLATTVVAVSSRPQAWFLRMYPASAANAAAHAAGKSHRVFANESYADWLVWTHPELAGRIAFDSRFELLTTRQLVSLFEFRTGLGNWRAAAAGYDVLVLSGKDEARAIAALIRGGRVSRVADDAGIVVLRRRPSAA